MNALAGFDRRALRGVGAGRYQGRPHVDARLGAPTRGSQGGNRPLEANDVAPAEVGLQQDIPA
jgi:hypothetical protein